MIICACEIQKTIEAKRAGIRQGSFGGKTTYPWEIANVGVWAEQKVCLKI